MVVDRGAYLRVLVPQYCVVTRSAIEKHLGRSFRFPGELEIVMSAFKGSLQLNQEDAAWRFAVRTRNSG
jgi:toluene monooxygenase system protein D